MMPQGMGMPMGGGYPYQGPIMLQQATSVPQGSGGTGMAQSHQLFTIGPRGELIAVGHIPQGMLGQQQSLGMPSQMGSQMGSSGGGVSSSSGASLAARSVSMTTAPPLPMEWGIPHAGNPMGPVSTTASSQVNFSQAPHSQSEASRRPDSALAAAVALASQQEPMEQRGDGAAALLQLHTSPGGTP